MTEERLTSPASAGAVWRPLASVVVRSSAAARPSPPVEDDALGAPDESAHRHDRGRAVDMAILATALVVGSALRLWQLGAIGLNSDEAVYAGQSASLAGNPAFIDNFPVVRAHPLLFHVLISPWYASGTPDLPGRYASALFGVGTIALTFVLGHLLYGRRAGAIAALLLAVMPYHVIVSRQVLLDGPMTFFATAALVSLALLARTGNGRWLVAAGACLGLASLTKETAVILVMAVYVFLSLVPRFWRPVRYPLAAAAVVLGLTALYPIVTALAGGGAKGQSYLSWQLSRRPNHDLLFYLTVVPSAMGVLTLVAAGAGLVLLRRRASWREVLLLAWVVVPFVFFEVWPVKGFPYLVMVTPAVAVLAARGLAWMLDRAGRRVAASAAAVAATVVVVASLLVPSAAGVEVPAQSGLAGAGGLPGGREAGLWVRDNLPAGARLMSLGPSMANVVMYYSGRRVDALSVSPNPLHRNPSYVAIANPDSALRSGTYQYVVWDAYSAQRSPVFAEKELALVRKFHGRVVHTELAPFRDGAPQPVVVVYEVTP